MKNQQKSKKSEKRAAISPLFILMLVFFVVAVLIFWLAPGLYKLGKSLLSIESYEELTTEEKEYYYSHLAVVYLNTQKINRYLVEDISVPPTNLDKLPTLTSDKLKCKSIKILGADVQHCSIDIIFSHDIDVSEEVMHDFNIYFQYNKYVPSVCELSKKSGSSFIYNCKTGGIGIEINPVTITIDQNKMTILDIRIDTPYLFVFPKFSTKDYYSKTQKKWADSELDSSYKKLLLEKSTSKIGLKIVP